MTCCLKTSQGSTQTNQLLLEDESTPSTSGFNDVLSFPSKSPKQADVTSQGSANTSKMPYPLP